MYVGSSVSNRNNLLLYFKGNLLYVRNGRSSLFFRKKKGSIADVRLWVSVKYNADTTLFHSHCLNWKFFSSVEPICTNINEILGIWRIQATPGRDHPFCRSGERYAWTNAYRWREIDYLPGLFAVEAWYLPGNYAFNCLDERSG